MTQHDPGHWLGGPLGPYVAYSGVFWEVKPIPGSSYVTQLDPGHWLDDVWGALGGHISASLGGLQPGPLWAKVAYE